MEEREVRPANDPETYVVQIPRDQVYRIPPPENARIIEQHTRNFPQNTKKCGVSRIFCWLLLVLLLLGLVAGLAILAVRATLYKPKPPKFDVTQFRSKNVDQLSLNKTQQSHGSPPEYVVTLHATNPNPRMSVSIHRTGSASLSFENTKIGHGGVPSSAMEEPNSSVRIPVTLYGSGATKKNLADEKEIKSMQLRIDTSIEFNSWVRNERKDHVVITCDFKVKGSSSKMPRVLSQECRVQL